MRESARAQTQTGGRSPSSAPETIEMVLVKGEWRPVGLISAPELEELERVHEAGDIRAEDTLRIILHGRR